MELLLPVLFATVMITVQAIVDEHKQEDEAQGAAAAPTALPLTPLTAAANSTQHTALCQDAAPNTDSQLTPRPEGQTPASAAAVAVAAVAGTAVAGTAVAATPAVDRTPAAAAATPAATPAPASLMKYTQPANFLTSSPLAATPASRQQGNADAPEPAADVALQARPHTAPPHVPSQATQNTEVSASHFTCLL